ncbi:thymidylate synthase [Candidatus Saccharibacteria bacterium]|nr:thymidylate synthase [Candidatus Saccharibacteria bacterium]
MSRFDEQYLDLCHRILDHGEKITTNPAVLKNNTAGSIQTNMPTHLAQTAKPTTTYSMPHQVLQFNLAEEFPILTTKRVAFKTAVLEMLWIYQVASNDVRWLHDRGVKIWDEWEIPASGLYAGKDYRKLYQDKGLTENPVGTIGTAYGWIVNRYNLTKSLIETLKTDPANRRMIMSLWQNEWLPTAALPSCVWNSQWNVTGGKLNVMVTVRSNDVPLGMPFNVSQYATLAYLLAQVTGLKPGQMTYVINNAHIYANQVEGIKTQFKNPSYPAPTLWLNPEVKDFFKFDNSRELKDIRLENYQNAGTIKMPVTE